MKRYLSLCALSAILYLAGPAAAQTTLVLNASTTTSIRDNGTHIVDNRLRSYVSGGGYINGFMKFNFSTLPNDAVITSMTLTTYHEAGFGNPSGSPSSAIFRVNDDSWTASTGNPALGVQVSPIYSSFPSGDFVAFNWTLNPVAVGYSTDLADDSLSLAMHSTIGTDSYVYFYGNATPVITPTLTLQYTSAMPEPGAWALMIGGFAVTGVALRRRRAVAIA